jgi:molybdate transport system ATP-binding protein
VAVDPLGERARVRLDGPPAIVAEVTAAAVADLALAPGTAVWCSLKATEIDVYPA